MVQIVIHRQGCRGKDPASRFLRHHLFKFIGHGQRRKRQGEVARGAFIPVAVPWLVDFFQPFQPSAVQRGAFEGGIQQCGATKRQLRDVITEFKGIVEQQQRALDVFVRQQLAQVTAIARLAKL